MSKILIYALVLGTILVNVNCQRLPGTPCSINPCNNGGTCQAQPANNVGYICVCPPPWMGYNCQFLNKNNVGSVATNNRQVPQQYSNNGPQQYPNAQNPNDPNRLKKQNYYAGNNWPNNNNAIFPNSVQGWQDQMNIQNPNNNAYNQWQPNLPNHVNPANNPWANPYPGYNNGYGGGNNNNNGNRYGYWQNSGLKLACSFNGFVVLMLSVLVQVLLN